MKVIIAGSRTINLKQPVEDAMRDSGFKVTEVVCGGAGGVDRIGEYWAKRAKVPVKYFKATWHLDGRAAGPMRNRKMAAYADALVAVWDGKSPGTTNMIEEMKKQRKPVFVFTFKVPVKEAP